MFIYMQKISLIPHDFFEILHFKNSASWFAKTILVHNLRTRIWTDKVFTVKWVTIFHSRLSQRKSNDKIFQKKIAKNNLDFAINLVIITYKHVNLSFTSTVTTMIERTFVWKHFSFQNTKFASAGKWELLLWNEWKLFIHIQKTDLFPDDIVERIKQRMACSY